MGRILRPEAKVLPESALIPERNLLVPPPRRFTHKVKVSQPFYYEATSLEHVDGTFKAGTKVLLLARGRGRLCHVADARGLRVLTAFIGLVALP